MGKHSLVVISPVLRAWFRWCFVGLGACEGNVCCKAGRKAAVAARTRLLSPGLGLSCLGKEELELAGRWEGCQQRARTEDAQEK